MRLFTSELIKSYKSRTVVNHVSIDVRQGEIVGLLGPNGAGKTTTFYMIVGLIKPNEGRIYLEDDNGRVTDITGEPVYRRAQMGVGYLAQEASVFRRLTVEDNIRAVLEMTKFSKQYQKQRCEELIEEFRLQKVRKSYGNQLSGGERRRTEIARAVAINPSFILLDEPFAGVDPIAVEDIQSIVGTLKDKNIGVIITDHNVDETLAITDRTYLLYEGKILKTGTAEDLAADEMVRRVYLGSNFELRTSPQIARQRKEREERERQEALRALGHFSQDEESAEEESMDASFEESVDSAEDLVEELQDILLEEEQSVVDVEPAVDIVPEVEPSQNVEPLVVVEECEHLEECDVKAEDTVFCDKSDCEAIEEETIEPEAETENEEDSKLG